ncbi:hypothetical protein [Actinomadura sp. HBU206391]|uniref:hypothetical protein n=1 Tax=Actinomadura sp. HBU206391 TaxID=2731692 RepID=UPI0016503599|nr:hypothetical protein [Actinomadura sp. HBU206391]MBC6457182.1 hypothetical protein [Actinomadura sp. HBU206391]
MTNTAVQELNRELDNPAGDLDAELRELERSEDLRETESVFTWFSAVRICCFKVGS